MANFRRVPDFELEVRKHLVLVGPNDSGKSALLRALGLLLSATNRQLVGAFSPRDFTDPAKPIVIECELHGFSDDSRGGFPDEISVTDAERLLVRMQVNLDPAAPDLPIVTRWFPESGHTRSPTPEQLSLVGWALIPASRELSRELGGGGRGGVLRALLNSLALQDGTDFELLFSEMREQMNAAPAFARFRDELANALTATLPDDVPPADLQLISPIDVNPDPLSEMTVGIREGSNSVPLTRQSDGIRALSVIAAFNIAHVGLNIVGIDEPESFLHPSNQENVAHLMSTSPIQRVVATHSSHVTRAFDPMDVVVMGRRRLPRQLPSAATGSDAVFTFRWWNQLVEPLTAEALVCVEGPADRTVEACADLLGLRRLRRSLVILDLQGADNFARAEKLFAASGFGIPFFGLVDEDHASAWAQTLGVPENDLESKGIFTCSADLEEMYVDGLGTVRFTQLLLSSGLFSKNRLLAASGRTALSDLTKSDFLTLLKSKKVEASVALATCMTLADVKRLKPICQLLASATA